MRFLFFGLLGMLSSIVVASPVLGVSDGDFLDLAPSFQQLNSDVIGFDSSDLDDVSDDVSDDIFSHPDINLDFEFLSSGPIAYFDELSSDPLPLESQPTLFENLGPIAYPDNLLSNVANYEDGSFDTSFDGTLVSSVVTAALGPPSCLSLNRGPSKVAFQSLCCEPPCVEDQSWRRICDHWESTCPVSHVACCQQFNDRWESQWTGFECVMAPGYPFAELDWSLLTTSDKCII